MLLKFNFKNYKSYKNVQEFSMIAGNTKSYEERLKKEKDYSVLKFSAIYGANGGGKTNVVEALEHMQQIVVSGLPRFRVPIYFKLDDSMINEPTYFEVYLLLDSLVYSYGFEYNSDNNRLSSEWLIKKDGRKETIIFTRDMKNGVFSCKDSKNKENKLKMYLDDIKNDDSKLFLSFVNYSKQSAVLEMNPELKNVYDWFENNLNIAEPESILTSGEYFMVEDKISKLAQLLKAFGTGIESIGSVTVDNDTAYQNIPLKLIDEFKMRIIDSNDNKVPNNKSAALLRSNKNVWIIIFEGENVSFKKICFYHDKDKHHPFSLADESEGTIRIIDLAEALLTERDNQLFIIDELDRKLHPQLTCKFVQLFLEKAKSTNNQLIVTTHESRLLDFDILRRDEIWFSDKDDEGKSSLYSLEEFNVRFDKKIDKAYLDGRYGGVPIFDAIYPSIEPCRE